MFKTSYVIQKPCRRSISSINPAKIFTTNALHVERYFLSFPYCLFMFDYDLKGKKYRVINFYFYLSDGKEIFVPPMTNLFSGSRVCLPQEAKKYKSFESKKDFFNFLFNCFWSSSFSSDLDYHVEKYKDENKKIIDYNYWQNKTKKNPNWIPSSKSFLSAKDYDDYDNFKFLSKTFLEMIKKSIH